MTDDPFPRLRNAVSLLTPRRLASWGAGLLLVSWFIYIHTIATPGLIDRAGRFKGTDYIQFYVMGSMVLDHRVDELYDPYAHLEEARHRIDPTVQLYAAHPNYGPQVALAFAPMAMLPFRTSLAVFLALSLACYALSVAILWRECDALREHHRLVALLAMASPLLFSTMRYGQASAFSLLMWSVAFAGLRRGRGLLSGVAIGCMAFKPQLAALAAVALLAGREWRTLAWASATVAVQLGVGWIVAGSTAMSQYVATLWSLALDPDAVLVYPSEVHSIRGFLHLLVASRTIVAAGSIAALCIGVAAAARIWRAPAPIHLRWSAVAVLTILAAPHLLTYDLLLLTVPLLLVADWTVENTDHPMSPAVGLLLVAVYFSPFSANIARLCRVQLSVIVMAVLSWCLYRSIVAPDAEAAEPAAKMRSLRVLRVLR